YNAKFEINTLNGNIATRGNIYYDGSLIHLSSKNFKSNIQPVSEELINDILKIDSKIYVKNNQGEIGIILEDVIDKNINITKYLVEYIDINELNQEFRSKLDSKYIITKNNKKFTPYGIKYENITPLLLEIVKKQQNEIEN